MNQQQVEGIVRAVVSAIGGYFVGRGIVDADTVAAIGGGLATIVTAVWSVWSKRASA